MREPGRLLVKQRTAPVRQRTRLVRHPTALVRTRTARVRCPTTSARVAHWQIIGLDGTKSLVWGMKLNSGGDASPDQVFEFVTPV